MEPWHFLWAHDVGMIKHSGCSLKFGDIYRLDGVHHSAQGSDVWPGDLRDGLVHVL